MLSIYLTVINKAKISYLLKKFHISKPHCFKLTTNDIKLDF